jgi:hypothetical protein
VKICSLNNRTDFYEPAQTDESCFFCEDEIERSNPTESNPRKLVWCVGCKVYYCEAHWSSQPLHIGKNKRSDDHVQTSPSIKKWVSDLIDTPTGERQEKLDKDMRHLWFGINVHSRKSFVNDNLYTELLLQSSFPSYTEQFPCLLSFVGTTGSGKSTIIVSFT